MSLQEFSNQFDVLVDSYRRFKALDSKEILDSIEFNEYEKSVFLTKAQQEIIISLYNGKNQYQDSFEKTEELRRYLDAIVKTKSYTVFNDDIISDTVDSLYPGSIFFELPQDLAFITYEQVTFDDSSLGCYNYQTADVTPVTQDEYNRIIKNPFRGPTKYHVLRIDTGDNKVEIISKYTIGKYVIKYVSKPTPIILEDLPNELSIEGISDKTPCKLNDILHENILKRAVQLALMSKSINVNDE